jgi:hypothetical protein
MAAPRNNALFTSVVNEFADREAIAVNRSSAPVARVVIARPELHSTVDGIPRSSRGKHTTMMDETNEKSGGHARLPG